MHKVLTFFKRFSMPRWAKWPEKAGLLIAVGGILIFTGLRPVFAGGLGQFRAASDLGEDQVKLVATAIPPSDLISAYAVQPSPTPFQPAEASRIQEILQASGQKPTPIPLYIPDSISIPVIGLEAGIEPVGADTIELNGINLEQWNAPDEFAVGWHDTSAPLGRPGNTVLNGHNNVYGEVFRNLDKLKSGDKIYLTSGDVVFSYQVTNSMRLKERYEDVTSRLENARWIESSLDERITLITCWPYTNNTYRWVVVAEPTGSAIKPSILN